MIVTNSNNDSLENTVPKINGTEEQQKVMKDLFHLFNITTTTARNIIQSFIQEMQKGLDREGATGEIVNLGCCL